MKVLVNGGLNLSELDGWWAEAYSPKVGWALGDGLEHVDVSAWDAMEADRLYRMLEEEIVPCFYRRDENGLPQEWIARMRESMAQLTGRFSSNRMVREYTEQFYVPLAGSYRQRSANDSSLATDIENWHTLLNQHWGQIYFGNVTADMCAEGYLFQVQVYLDGIPPEAVCVELYADASGALERASHPLLRAAPMVGANNGYLYTGTVLADRPIANYTPRVIPAHISANVPLEASFITWYR
jgi:starch phosphorylase